MTILPPSDDDRRVWSRKGGKRWRDTSRAGTASSEPPRRSRSTARPRWPWTSDLSLAELNAVRSVGFRPVGQVLGVAVYQIGYTGTWWCGGNYRPGYVHAGTEAGALIRALSDGRRLALTRMTEEAAALGADGVVGVELELGPFPDVPTAVEFHAIGTAIRADGDVRPTTPFLSILSGQDFAKLLRAGWVPTGIAMGISVVARHDDLATVLQAGSTWNTEVAGFTQLVQGARHNARTALADDVRRLGGEGVVIRDTTLSTSMQACSGVGSGGGQHDHLAEAVVTGTAITRFRRSDPDNTPQTLPILRLG